MSFVNASHILPKTIRTMRLSGQLFRCSFKLYKPQIIGHWSKILFTALSVLSIVDRINHIGTQKPSQYPEITIVSVSDSYGGLHISKCT